MSPTEPVKDEGEVRLVAMSGQRAFHMRARAEAILENLDAVEAEWGVEARQAQEADAKDCLALADAYESGITAEEARVGLLDYDAGYADLANRARSKLRSAFTDGASHAE